MNKRFSILIPMLLALSASASAQEVVRADSGVARAEPPSGSHAATAMQIHERFYPFQALLPLTGAERRNSLEELVEGQDEDLAVLAARQLIRDQATGEEARIVSRISGWSERNQIILLEELRSHTGQGLEIAREVLRDSLNRPAAITHYDAQPSSAVDLAAILIARQPGPDDARLIAQVLQVNPNTRGPWLAARNLGLIGSEQRFIGVTTWRNEALPMIVRASAAVALSDSDSAAESFAANLIRAALGPDSNQSGAVGAGTRMRLQQLALIGLIEFLPPQSATQILTELLGGSHGPLDAPIYALALLRSPLRLEGKDIPPVITDYLSQMRTGLFIGF